MTVGAETLTMSAGERLTADARAVGSDASVVRLLDVVSAASKLGKMTWEDTVTLAPVIVSWMFPALTP